MHSCQCVIHLCHFRWSFCVSSALQRLLPPEYKYSNCEKALLCTVWAIQRFSNYIGAQKVIIENCHQPGTFLNIQRITDDCGDQRTHSYLVNDTPRTGRWGKICPKLQILTWKRASGLPKLFNGHAVDLGRTERTPTTSTDKSQVLRGECVWRNAHSICRWLLLQSQGQFTSWSGCGLAQQRPVPTATTQIRPSIIAICRNSSHPHHPTTGCIPQHQRTLHLYRLEICPSKLHLPFNWMEKEWIQDR